MNEKFATRKVDLVTVVADLFDFNNTEQFIKYIKDNNTLVSFELERGSWMPSDGRVGEEFKKTRDFCVKYKNNSTFFHKKSTFFDKSSTLFDKKSTFFDKNSICVDKK